HAHGPAGDHHELDPNAVTWMRSPCLGMCDHAPAALLQGADTETPMEWPLAPIDRDAAIGIVAADNATEPTWTITIGPGYGDQLLRRIAKVDSLSLEAYRKSGGYAALTKAVQMGAEAVINEVTDSK